MQQSIQRMAGQLQSMGQEVRELSQMASQLAQQHSNHFQQMQNQLQNSNMHGGTLYNLAGNEQASAHLLQTIAQVCSEMNHHLRTISQQLGHSGSNQQQQGGLYGFGQGANMQGIGMTQASGGGQGQNRAPEGPIYTDTTHYSRDDYPGHSQTPGNRMTSSVGGSAGAGGTGAGAAGGGMSGGSADQNQQQSGANMMAGGASTEYFSDQSGAMGSSVQGSQMRVGSSQSASGMQARSSQGGQGAGQGQMSGSAQGGGQGSMSAQSQGGNQGWTTPETHVHPDSQPMLSAHSLSNNPLQSTRQGQGQAQGQGSMNAQGGQSGPGSLAQGTQLSGIGSMLASEHNGNMGAIGAEGNIASGQGSANTIGSQTNNMRSGMGGQGSQMNAQIGMGGQGSQMNTQGGMGGQGSQLNAQGGMGGQGSQMNAQGGMGGQGSQMNAQGGMSGQGSQMNAHGGMGGQGSQMNAKQALSENDLKNQLNEYREEPHSNTYPFNRWTT